MFQVDVKTFNPEILYVFDYYNTKSNLGKYHSHDFIELSIILDGQVDYIVADHPYVANKGTVFLFNPGVPHQEMQHPQTSCYQLHIGIRNVMLNGLARNRFPFTQPVVNIGKHRNAFMEVCQRIVAEKNATYPGYEVMIKSLVMQLLLYILRETSQNQINSNELALSASDREKQVLVSQTIYYLERHHQEDLSLQRIADSFFVSPTYLSKVFKEATDETPINYLITLRLERAKKLLENSPSSIKEIAASVGYQDAYHFSKIFKKHYGQAPSNFQNKE